MQSKYTRIGYLLTIIAFIIQGTLWILHIQDITDYGQYFQYISLIEMLFALSGLLTYDLLNQRGLMLKPNLFSPTKSLVRHTIIIFLGIALVQFFISLMIPLTVKDWEIALSIQFAGPSEENFFRGVLISIFILLDMRMANTYLGKPIIRIRGKKLSLWILIGILISSYLFALIHVNYYESLRYILGTFLCGVWLAFTYWYWEDLTACILAHSLLNFITVIQTFWMVGF